MVRMSATILEREAAGLRERAIDGVAKAMQFSAELRFGFAFRHAVDAKWNSCEALSRNAEANDERCRNGL